MQKNADRAFDAWDPKLLDGSDLIFAALPHGESQALADAMIGSGAKIVDLGADFRLDTAEEVAIYEAGGVLQRFAQDFLESTKAA